MKSTETILQKGMGAFGRVIWLTHISAGTEIAGSGTRETGECWAYVSFDRDGTRHGRRFKTMEEAQAEFERFTTPITEVKTKPSNCLFPEVRINQAFTFNGSLWIKTSSRTARLAENDRVFYFKNSDRVGL